MALDYLTEEIHGITVNLVYTSRSVIEQFSSPICSICGESITEKDTSCVRIDIPVSGKMEWMHDTVNCFERYATALAMYFNEKPTGIGVGHYQ